jgi:hypothetical protein
MRSPVISPQPLQYNDAVYDEQRRMVVMFGGWDGKLNGIYEDTWLYAPVNHGSYDSYAPGCQGSAPRVPVLERVSVDPYIGSQFQIRLRNILPITYTSLILGASRMSWGSIPLPLDLGWFGMPGCKLATSHDFALPLWSANGESIWSFGIPSDAGLIGLRFYSQAFALHPGGNPTPFLLSNACEGRIGSK